MNRFTRLAVTALLSAAALPVAAETWRLSSMVSPDSIEGQAYEILAEKTAEYSNGDLTIRIFPNSQIGEMDAVVEQLSAGVIQLAPSAMTFLARWEDNIRYASAPFLFDDYDHWAEFIRGDMVQGWLGKVTDASGISVLGDAPAFPRGSFRTLLSVDPITSAEDIAELRIRQFNSQLVIDVWENQGAEVVVLSWGEVYDAINRNIVNAVTSPLELIESTRFYEVAPNIVRTDEYPQAIAFMMNQEAFDDLSPENQDALLRAHADASAFAWETVFSGADETVERIKALEGVTYSDSFDTSAILATTSEFYAAREAAGELPEGLMDAVEAARESAK
ncbi:TRAP-type C4-dicarboxylate transport system substrate-binding protein [Pacificibacter maritimus]|uniref:TRAP-type C4-dicarboxylate transport system substrate-binding protein n=1 Tax=Pacificibacter maritimus TaxID=762213 RepID=A0A3N4V4X2_9RHOB|nr:TRAP transporter substrate-binding protein [Pacificibacter maritimus]RPE72157.1 TRAP-type C4-dicarboxylate transport system substrate-binding protein [Pacificibacter maritimus]